jgi:large subunit ribosomal protein L7/L12
VREEAAAAAPVSPKIASIVDSVEGLTLLEVSELVSALKVRRKGEGRPVGRR